MKEGARKYYHATLWPKVCQTQRWNKGDTHKRRWHTVLCLAAIDPKWDSEKEYISAEDLDTAQITALFCYLNTLSEPSNPKFQKDWERCKKDYKAYHKSKIADYWQKKTYGKSSNRLTKNRFENRRMATGSRATDEALDDEQASQRLLTMQTRRRAAEKRADIDRATRKYQLL